MALKKTLTKEEHSKLSPDLQKEYVADGDGFKLDVEGGFEDTAALKRAKDHEKREASEAKRMLKEAQDELATAQQELKDMLTGAVPKNDVARLEKSHADKLAKRETELTTQISTLQKNLESMLVDNVANTIAAEISTSPGVIMPHIKSRLKAEYTEGKAVTRVLDKEGNVSAFTPDDLKKEFLTDKQFAPILIASKGSGGGAGGAGGGGANTLKKPDFAKASVAEIAAWNESQGVGSETFVRGGSAKE